MRTTTARLFSGDCREVLRGLPAESVHMVVTSPPYWSLRDYGILPTVWGGDPACAHVFKEESLTTEVNGGNWAQAENGDGLRSGCPQTRFRGDTRESKTTTTTTTTTRATCQSCGAWRGVLGLEPTPELWSEHIVEVFREVRRVLRKDGTVWLNLGDSFWGGRSFVGSTTGTDGVFDRRKGRLGTLDGQKNPAISMKRNRGENDSHLKETDLIGQPWTAAFALRADGWFLRQAITWAKKTPMPESVTSRPACSTEMVFLLAKSKEYFYDHIGGSEPATSATGSGNGFGRADYIARGGRGGRGGRGSDARYAPQPTRNMRNFWLLGPEPSKLAHFATFPTEVPRRAIRAGTSERGVCVTCAAPWVRVVERAFYGDWHPEEGSNGPLRVNAQTADRKGSHFEESYSGPKTVGWAPSCACYGPFAGVLEAPVAPSVVLDPFNGSGTTAVVAQQLGRNAIGIDLSPKNIAMAEKWLAADRRGKDLRREAPEESVELPLFGGVA